MRRVLLVIALLLTVCDRSARAIGQAQGLPAPPPQVDVVRVVARRLVTIERLPAELTPWEAVAIYPKVRGFVEEIPVDRGSVVRRGQLLVRLSAPELVAEAAQAQAALEADRSTFERLQDAARTKGAVSANEIELAKQSVAAGAQGLRSLKSLAGYLAVTAPFDGIITERNVHPGALVGPPGEPLRDALPMLRIEQNTRLRLTVPVPEADAAGVAQGATVEFQVRAWPGRTFTGTISRISHSVDVHTRTMAAEADVDNKPHLLDPGMFAEVSWPVRRPGASLFVPVTSVIENTDATFVEAVRQGKVRRVRVQRGKTMGDLVEVFGALGAGEVVLARASEDFTDGTPAIPRLVHR